MKLEQIPADMTAEEARSIAAMLLEEVRTINDQIEDSYAREKAGLNVDLAWRSRAMGAKKFKKVQMRAYERHAKAKDAEAYQARLNAATHAKETALANRMENFEKREAALLRKLENIRLSEHEQFARVRALRSFIAERLPGTEAEVFALLDATQKSVRAQLLVRIGEGL